MLVQKGFFGGKEESLVAHNGAMSFHRVTGSTGEPINWKITHFANISGSEEFVAQLVMENA